MWPDRVSNPGPLTYESGALPTALPGPALPSETARHIWLPLRLSVISDVLSRLLCLVNSFLQRLSVCFSFLPIVSTGSRITRTVSAGSHFSWTVVSAGSKRSRTVSEEAKKTHSLCRKRKLADSFIPSVLCAGLRQIQNISLHPFLPGNPLKGHRQTVQTQIRRHIMWRLIRTYYVC